MPKGTEIKMMFKSFVSIFGFICGICASREIGVNRITLPQIETNRSRSINGRLYTGIGQNAGVGVTHQEIIKKIIDNLPEINCSLRKLEKKIFNTAKSIEKFKRCSHVCRGIFGENNHSIILSDIQKKIRCLSIKYGLQNLDSSIIYLANSNDIERLTQISNLKNDYKRLDSDFQSLKRLKEALESNAEVTKRNADSDNDELQDQTNHPNIPPSGGSRSTAQESRSTETENNDQDSQNRCLDSLKKLLSYIKKNIEYGNNLLESAIKMNREGLPDRIRNDFSNNPVDNNYYKAARVFSDQRELLEYMKFLENFLENIENDEFESLKKDYTELMLMLNLAEEKRLDAYRLLYTDNDVSALNLVRANVSDISDRDDFPICDNSIDCPFSKENLFKYLNSIFSDVDSADPFESNRSTVLPAINYKMPARQEQREEGSSEIESPNQRGLRLPEFVAENTRNNVDGNDSELPNQNPPNPPETQSNINGVSPEPMEIMFEWMNNLLNDLHEINGSLKEIRKNMSNASRFIEVIAKHTVTEMNRPMFNDFFRLVKNLNDQLFALKERYRLDDLNSIIYYLQGVRYDNPLLKIKRNQNIKKIETLQEDYEKLKSDFAVLMESFTRLEGEINLPASNLSQSEQPNAEARENDINGESGDLQNQINPSNISSLNGFESTVQGLSSTEAQNIISDINANINDANQNAEENSQSTNQPEAIVGGNEETSNSTGGSMDGRSYDESREENPKGQKRKAQEMSQDEFNHKKIRSANREGDPEVTDLFNLQENKNSENLEKLENETRGAVEGSHIATIDANKADGRNSEQRESGYLIPQELNAVEAKNNRAELDQDMLTNGNDPSKENYEVSKSCNPSTSVLPSGAINPLLSRDAKGAKLTSRDANGEDETSARSTEEIPRSTEEQNNRSEEEMYMRSYDPQDVEITSSEGEVIRPVETTQERKTPYKANKSTHSSILGLFLIQRKANPGDKINKGLTEEILGPIKEQNNIVDEYIINFAAKPKSEMANITEKFYIGEDICNIAPMSRKIQQDVGITSSTESLMYMQSYDPQDVEITSSEGEVIRPVETTQERKTPYKANKSTHSSILGLFLFILNFIILYNSFAAISYFADLGFAGGNIDFSSKLLKSFMRTISFAGIFISFPFRGLRRFVALRFCMTKEPRPDKNTSFLSLIYEAIESVISSKI